MHTTLQIPDLRSQKLNERISNLILRRNSQYARQNAYHTRSFGTHRHPLSAGAQQRPPPADSTGRAASRGLRLDLLFFLSKQTTRPKVPACVPERITRGLFAEVCGRADRILTLSARVSWKVNEFSAVWNARTDRSRRAVNDSLHRERQSCISVPHGKKM